MLNMFSDFNKEFQRILDMPDSVKKFVKLRQLAADFAYCASTSLCSCLSHMCRDLWSYHYLRAIPPRQSKDD